MKARGAVEIRSTFSLTSALDGVGGQRHDPAALTSGRETRYPLYRRLGGPTGVPRNFVRRGVQQIQLRTEDRENGDLGDGSPLVRGSEGNCDLVQEISFHIVKFS